MKKALHLVIASLIFSTIAQAQIIKGKFLVGGTLAYSHSTVSTNNNFFPKQYYVIINPAVGVAVKENVIVGLEASFFTNNQKYGTANNFSESKSRNYGGGVFVRRYVPLLKRFYFYAQAAAGGNKTNSWQKYNNQRLNNTEEWGAALTLNPGLTYALTKRLYVESGLNGFSVLGYSHSKSESTDSNTGVVSTSKGNMFNFSTSLGGGNGLNIGFRLLL